MMVVLASVMRILIWIAERRGGGRWMITGTVSSLMRKIRLGIIGLMGGVEGEMRIARMAKMIGFKIGNEGLIRRTLV